MLSEALKSLGAEIQPLKKSEAISLVERELNKVEALIFNSSTHWFAIRKINNIWFNLNSTNSFPGPELISDFYLSAFIKGTEDIGYTNFLVTKLPPISNLSSDIYKNLQPYQRLVNVEDIIKARESKKNSLKKEIDKEEKKFNAFSGKGILLSNDQSTNSNNPQFEDEEMRQAYELSLDEYIFNLKNLLPKEPNENEEEYYNLIFKYGDKSFSRKFISDNKIFVNIF